MVEALTTSRLSLNSTASTNLQTLVKKLESVVSEIPPSAHTQAGLLYGKKDWENDSDGDPTELFHRDIGIQTSGPSTPQAPLSSLSSFTESTPAPSQATRLTQLHISLSEILASSNSEGETVDDVYTDIKVLKNYLDDLANEPMFYGYSNQYGNNRKEDRKNDEITKVKDGIRSVKGVLLSTRSFPGISRRN